MNALSKQCLFYFLQFDIVISSIFCYFFKGKCTYAKKVFMAFSKGFTNN